MNKQKIKELIQEHQEAIDDLYEKLYGTVNKDIHNNSVKSYKYSACSLCGLSGAHYCIGKPSEKARG